MSNIKNKINFFENLKNSKIKTEKKQDKNNKKLNSQLLFWNTINNKNKIINNSDSKLINNNDSKLINNSDSKLINNKKNNHINNNNNNNDDEDENDLNLLNSIIN